MDASDKLEPIIIGKYKRPRCFHGVQSLLLPYYTNKKAWMRSNIFSEWLLRVDGRMRREIRSVRIFLDNCSAHVKAVDEVKDQPTNVSVKFLPGNCTSQVQPMDSGVIRSFKCGYRSRLLQSTIVSIDAQRSAPSQHEGCSALRTCIMGSSYASHN